MNDADMFALGMEINLTIALRTMQGDNVCVEHIKKRLEVLVPEIVKKAEETSEDPVDIFHRFQKGLHARHDQGHA